MPDEPKPKTAYETAKEAGDKFRGYFTPLQLVKQGRQVEKFNEIAANAAMELEDGLTEADAEELLASGNVYQFMDYVNAAAKKYDIKTTQLFSDGLEGIVGSTPEKSMKGIEKRLHYYAPKEDKDVPAEYQEVAKVHREAAEMGNILKAYGQADEAGKDSIRKGIMLGKIKKYYESLYKNGKENEKLKEQNEALLKVSLTWAARNPRICEDKFVKLVERKMQELKRKIVGLTKEEYNKLAKTNPDNLKERISNATPAYLMAAMSPESLKNMYVDQWAEEAKNGED